MAFGGNTAIQLIDVTAFDAAENTLCTSASISNQVEVNLAAENTYLVTDQNNNGIVEDRSELFSGSVGEGFDDLASFDSNNDSPITALYDNFVEILVWQDANGNDITDNSELISLAEAGITSVSTDFTDVFSSEAIQANILGGLITKTGLTELI